MEPTMAQISTLQVLSPCKINLFLYVLGKRPDGFHDLQSLFCLLNYGDTMDFTVEHDAGKAINLPNTMGFALEDNLIYKAAKLLQTEAGLDASVTVNVTKRLPMGGGLGGGSSNAATTRGNARELPLRVWASCILPSVSLYLSFSLLA